MKFSIIVVAVWMQTQIEPGLVEVANESTACAIVQKFKDVEYVPPASKILDMAPYAIYPDIVGTNVSVKIQRLTCPSGFDFSQVSGVLERKAKVGPGHKPCETFSEKKDWKSYFQCVANWIDK